MKLTETRIDLQVKKMEKLNSKINKFLADKESLVKEMEERKAFLYSYLMTTDTIKFNHEDNMKYNKLFKEIIFLRDSIAKIDK